MSELETVAEIAREALMESGESGAFLWDRARRLASNAEYISRLSELGEVGSQVDGFCLSAAAYFSEAGLAGCLESRPAAVCVFKVIKGDDLLEISAKVAEQRLSGVISRTKIEKVTRIITESGSNFTMMSEAMILSDARNLDDIGLAGILNEYGRYLCRGRAVVDILKSWQRKIDYRYWQARLKEGFRFESVRKLAERRLCTAEGFMEHLRVEAQGRDLEELAVRSVEEQIKS